MKKTLFVLLALFFTAAGGTLFVHNWIGNLGDDVTIKETVLAGDKRAAEGVTVTTHTLYKGTAMRWETAYTVGEKPVTDCQFQYTKKQDDGDVSKTADASFHTYPADSEDWYDDYGAVIDYDNVFGTPEELIQPVVERTKAGESHEETAYLDETLPYYDVYLSFFAKYGMETLYDNFDKETASEYFRIPIQEDDRLEIRVEKKRDGRCKSVEIEPVEVSYVETSSVIKDDVIYLFMTDMYSYNSDIFEEEQVKLPERICGLHRIPYVIGEDEYGGEVLEACFDQAELVCPMDQGERIFHPFFSADGASLMAFSVEDNRISLLVFDGETFALEQKLYLFDCGEMDESAFFEDSFAVQDKGDYMILTSENNQFSLLTKNRDGVWQVELSDRLLVKDEPYFLGGEELTFVYGEDKLVLACLCLQDKMIDERESAASFQLTVYEDGKRVYDGFYESSLDYDLFDTWDVSGAPITVSLPSAASR